MITNTKIGYNGRLGNQMFQFASIVGIARRNNLNVKFPFNETPTNQSFADGIIRKVFNELNLAFNIPTEFFSNNIIVHNNYNEEYFHFNEHIFNTIKDDTNMDGYFQSEKYFEHIEDEIKSLFTFKQNIYSIAKNNFPNTDLETVSIHIRMGDYKFSNVHPVCNNEFYKNAIEKHFSDKPYYFIIFSDEIEQAKNMILITDNIMYIDTNNSYVELCMMTMCNHNIIANSSFSWWGAWLNPNENKKVIAPNKWFTGTYSDVNVSDIYCGDWIIL